MVARSDVSRLADATGKVSADAEALLADFFRSVDLGKPERVRDALLEVVPAISSEFGDLSAGVAADWYEQVRAKEVGGRYVARLGSPDDADRVIGSVRWASGELFKDNPQGAFDLLKGALQRHVTYGARDTIARNVRLDPARPRFAHVPTGSDPCGFCVIMGSRGWVYTTREAAELNPKDRDGLHSQFHDNCHCQVVASWDATQAHIDGYDPDLYYSMYESSRKPGDSLGQTVNRMRKDFPDFFRVAT
ncbi:hypothetical protein U6G28_08825 [Actinomycetaceae bacterium MB13-C1-2]|nr:hypothetical protein U6G28_08825 [Actinomycetaceae bacterium MB13-C1-2]